MKNEGFDSVESFEDPVKDFTHCTDDDVDIPLDENDETSLSLDNSYSSDIDPVKEMCVT